MEDLEVIKVSLDMLLEESDAIFVHARVSEENKHMINMAFFQENEEKACFY